MLGFVADDVWKCPYCRLKHYSLFEIQNYIEPSARERPLRGFIPPLILYLFGYRLSTGLGGESESMGVAILRFLFGSAFSKLNLF